MKQKQKIKLQSYVLNRSGTYIKAGRGRQVQVGTRDFMGWKLPTKLPTYGAKNYQKAQYANVVFQLNEKKIMKAYEDSGIRLKTIDQLKGPEIVLTDKQAREKARAIFVNGYISESHLPGYTGGNRSMTEKYMSKKIFQGVSNWDKVQISKMLRQNGRTWEYWAVTHGRAKAEFVNGKVTLKFKDETTYKKALAQRLARQVATGARTKEGITADQASLLQTALKAYVNEYAPAGADKNLLYNQLWQQVVTNTNERQLYELFTYCLAGIPASKDENGEYIMKDEGDYYPEDEDKGSHR